MTRRVNTCESMTNSPLRGKPEFLIIAASARFLAEAAAACGYALSTVDGFADVEVRTLAERAVRVPLNEDGLDGRAVREACARLLQEREFAGLVIGPGLDAQPELLAQLSSQLPLMSNAAEVFALCCDRRRFTEQLRRVNIPHPAACNDRFTLLKRAGASGGGHVRFTRRDAVIKDSRSYLQTYLPGTVVSHLFFAGREGITTIGWNTQWQSRHDESRPFCYGGAVNRSALDAALRGRTEDYAARLTQAFSLVGMNNVDYIVCADELHLLELNPRMSATMQLHEDKTGALFAGHLEACRSSSLPGLPPPQAPRAHAVLYASDALAIPDDFHWPDAACDRPVGATRLSPGEPICTLTAAAVTAADALTRLQDTIRTMAARLNGLWPQMNAQSSVSEIHT